MHLNLCNGRLRPGVVQLLILYMHTNWLFRYVFCLCNEWPSRSAMFSCLRHLSLTGGYVSEWVWKLLSRVRVFCKAMDCSPAGSSVHGISQARELEWVAISFSRGSSQPRGQTQGFCIADSLPSEPPGKPQLTHNSSLITTMSFLLRLAPWVLINHGKNEMMKGKKDTSFNPTYHKYML